jgi:hypothetical protein
MLRRATAKQKIWEPYNTHLYQRMMRSSRSHVNVTWRYAFLGLLLSNLALFGGSAGWLLSPWVLAGPSAVLILLYVVISKRLTDGDAL